MGKGRGNVKKNFLKACAVTLAGVMAISGLFFADEMDVSAGIQTSTENFDKVGCDKSYSVSDWVAAGIKTVKFEIKVSEIDSLGGRVWFIVDDYEEEIYVTEASTIERTYDVAEITAETVEVDSAGFSGTLTITYITTYDVTITNPEGNHIVLSSVEGNGTETQTGLAEGMTPVIYTVEDGYYFPEDYAVEGSNGVTVTRNSPTQITVAGTLTDDAAVTLKPAAEKESQPEPDVTGGVDKIEGTTTEMEYASEGSAETWETCAAGVNLNK